MTPLTFGDGWRYFWDAVAFGWPAFLGFAVALVVVHLLGELVRAFLSGVIQGIRSSF